MSNPHDPNSVKATLGKPPLPKKAFAADAPTIHPGMTVQTRVGGLLGGGHTRSAVDALTGIAVVPGRDGRAATAGPMTKPPVEKNLRSVEHSPGMRSRTGDAPEPEGVGVAHSRAQARKADLKSAAHELGRRIIEEALTCAGPDHPGNLGRGRK